MCIRDRGKELASNFSEGICSVSGAWLISRSAKRMFSLQLRCVFVAYSVQPDNSAPIVLILFKVVSITVINEVSTAKTVFKSSLE